MDDRDELDQTIQRIAALFAEAYLRLSEQTSPQNGLESPGTLSPHVTGRLTA